MRPDLDPAVVAAEVQRRLTPAQTHQLAELFALLAVDFAEWRAAGGAVEGDTPPEETPLAADCGRRLVS